MGLLKLLGLSTDHQGQHAAGKHTKKAKETKQPRKPKGGKTKK